MNEYCVIELDSPTPLVTAAIHDGHKLSENLSKLSGLSETERLREEDPYTGIWALLSENHIIARKTRFEFDLNRSPDKAIYILPADAWGLNVWKRAPSEDILRSSFEQYSTIYERIHVGLSKLIARVGKIVILDLHSYNHRRGGPDALPEDPLLNPEINIGTGTMDRDYWSDVVDRFLDDLRAYDFRGRPLDIRENVKFRGGYFPRWVHDNFKDSACCISIEMKKFFMDEWSGKPDWDAIDSIKEVLKGTTFGLIEEISKMKTHPKREQSI